MRKKPHILTLLGIGIYVIYSLVNRFVYEIPDRAALPLVVVSMAMIVGGVLISQRKQKS